MALRHEIYKKRDVTVTLAPGHLTIVRSLNNEKAATSYRQLVTPIVILVCILLVPAKLTATDGNWTEWKCMQSNTDGEHCPHKGVFYRWKLVKEFHKYSLRYELRQDSKILNSYSDDILPYVAYYVNGKGKAVELHGKMHLHINDDSTWSGVGNLTNVASEAENDVEPLIEAIDVDTESADERLRQTAAVSSWGSCHDDLNRTGQMVPDAAAAAERAKRASDDLDNCKRSPEVYDVNHDGCRSQRWNYESESGTAQIAMDDLDSRLRTVQDSCGYEFTVNRMNSVQAAEAKLQHANASLCTAMTHESERQTLSPSAALAYCIQNQSESWCKACLRIK